MCLISSELLDPQLDGHLRRLTDSTPLASLMRRRLAARLGVERDPRGRRRCAAGRAAGAGHGVPAGPVAGGRAGRASWSTRAIRSRPSRSAELQAAAGLPVHRVARIEPWIDRLKRRRGELRRARGRVRRGGRARAERERRRLQVDHRLPHRPRRAAVEPRATPTPRSHAGATTAGRSRASTRSPCATTCCAARSRSPRRRAACPCTSTAAAATRRSCWATRARRTCSRCSPSACTSRCC